MKELDFSAEKGKEEMTRLRGGMSDLLDERVGEHSRIGLNPFPGGRGEGTAGEAAWTCGGTACSPEEGEFHVDSESFTAFKGLNSFYHY